MAKLIVEVDIRNISFTEIFDKESDWYDKEDPDMIIIDEAYLKRANCDDSFYAFKLVGAKP